MAKEAYIEKNFRGESLRLINLIDGIIKEYRAQGLRMTLRQTYYQLVARDVIPNKEESYKMLSGLLSNARLAGLIDWDAIEDRVRQPRMPLEFTDLKHRVESAVYNYRLPRWADQEYYVELWCFPPETPVVTPTGAVAIGTIEIGDQVLDAHGDVREVRHVHVRETAEDLYVVKACGLLPFRATGNHPVLVMRVDPRTRHEKGARVKHLAPAFFPANQLEKGDMLLVPRVKAVLNREAIDLPRGRVSKRNIIPLDDLTCKALGLYLSEGCVRGDGRTTQFTFHQKEEAYALVVKTWAERAGLHWSEVFGAGTRVVYVYGKALAAWLSENFGNGSWVKRLPDWAMALPWSKQSRVLEYHFRGDASLWDLSRSAMCLSTRSAVLAQQEQWLFARNGTPASLAVVQDHGAPMYRLTLAGTHGVVMAAEWCVTLPERIRRFSHMKVTDDYILHPVRAVEREAYAGMVFNLEVAGTNSYCVPCVVHNCEKDAIANVLSPITSRKHITMMINRGYSSQSAMYESAQRFKETGKPNILFYLGDLDPSGEDMVRDIRDRLEMFGVQDIEVHKIALTWDQVQQYKPPTNPAKFSDPRAKGYVEKYGKYSWEVDALNPRTLTQIITDSIDAYLDQDAMDAVIAQEESDKKRLRKAVEEIMKEKS